MLKVFKNLLEAEASVSLNNNYFPPHFINALLSNCFAINKIVIVHIVITMIKKIDISLLFLTKRPYR